MASLSVSAAPAAVMPQTLSSDLSRLALSSPTPHNFAPVIGAFTSLMANDVAVPVAAMNALVFWIKVTAL